MLGDRAVRSQGAAEWPFYKRNKVERVLVEGLVHTTNPPLAAQLAVAGLGITRMISWIVLAELERGELVEVMPDWSCHDLSEGGQHGIPVYVLYAQGAGTAPPLKLRVFVERVKEIVTREVMPAVRRRT